MKEDYINKEDNYKIVEVEVKNPNEADSLAGLILKESLMKGKTIEIPSLNLKFKKKIK